MDFLKTVAPTCFDENGKWTLINLFESTPDRFFPDVLSPINFALATFAVLHLTAAVKTL